MTMICLRGMPHQLRILALKFVTFAKFGRGHLFTFLFAKARQQLVELGKPHWSGTLQRIVILVLVKTHQIWWKEGPWRREGTV